MKRVCLPAFEVNPAMLASRQRRRGLPDRLHPIALVLVETMIVAAATGCGSPAEPAVLSNDGVSQLLVIVLVLVVASAALTAVGRLIARIIAALGTFLEIVTKLGFAALVIGAVILAAVAGIGVQ